MSQNPPTNHLVLGIIHLDFPLKKISFDEVSGKDSTTTHVPFFVHGHNLFECPAGFSLNFAKLSFQVILGGFPVGASRNFNMDPKNDDRTEFPFKYKYSWYLPIIILELSFTQT